MQKRDWKQTNSVYRRLREAEEVSERHERVTAIKNQKKRPYAERDTSSKNFRKKTTLQQQYAERKKRERRQEAKARPEGRISPSSIAHTAKQSVKDAKHALQGIDRIFFSCALLLLILGLVMVLSSSSYKAILESDNAYYYFIRQSIFAVMGMVGLFVMAHINHTFVRSMAFPALACILLLIIYVTLFGVEIDGAKRWIQLGSFSFAPSDFAKPIGVICYACVLAAAGDAVRSWRGFLITLGLMLPLPVVVVIEDLGTALAIGGGLFVMLIVAGAPRRYLLGTLVSGIGAVILAILVEPYRIRRITGFLDPFAQGNLQGDGWQLAQSLYALGSGGFFGVGLGNSGQKLLYLPAMHTDFIFSVLSEELGFIGALGTITLFVIFVWRGLWIGLHLRDRYMSLAAIGLTMTIGIQAFINIGVCVGVLPITGITLPFISYGGTSLIATLAMVGYVLNLSRYIEV